jgi:NodT family efflux transporter outer membrane factor (OMF) lipoprotein
LLGHYPSGELQISDQLPELKTTVPVGLPSQLLIRRPDLIAAEHRLTAAGERLQEAQKNRLPSIRLTGSGGVGSSALNELLNWDSLVWSLLAGVTQPVFEGGRLDADRALAKARHGEAWANYAQTVLVAFQEVETALAAEDRFVQQLEQLQRATDEANEAADLALSRYQNGLTDIITLLDAQRRAFDAKSALLRTQRERLDNRVALYLALGGEFSQSGAESGKGDRQNP